MYESVTCLIMAGGRGSRYGSPNKIVANVCGKPLIRHVIDSIKSVCRDVYIAISKNTSDIAVIRRLCTEEVRCVKTSGEGYVKDLISIMCSLPKPTLVISGDIFTHKDIVEEFVAKALKIGKDVVTMVVSKNGIEEPVGISLFKSCGGTWANIVYSSESVVDVDTLKDLEIAESLCKNMR